MANSGENKTFKSGTKKILYNIIKYYDQEAEKREIIVPKTQPTKRVCQIVGVSVSTIKRIHHEAGDELYPDFTSPKKSKKDIFKRTAIACLDKTVIFLYLLCMTFLLLSGAAKAVIFMKKLLKELFLIRKKKGCFIILILSIRIFYCMENKMICYLSDQFKD